MLRISGLRLDLDYQAEDLKRAAAKKLGISVTAIDEIRLAKRSVVPASGMRCTSCARSWHLWRVPKPGWQPAAGTLP